MSPVVDSQRKAKLGITFPYLSEPVAVNCSVPPFPNSAEGGSTWMVVNGSGRMDTSALAEAREVSLTRFTQLGCHPCYKSPSHRGNFHCHTRLSLQRPGQ